MPKKSIVFSLILIPVLAIFGLYFFYLYPQDISFTGFFAGILPSLTGQKDNKLIRINLHNYALALYEDGVLIKQTRVSGTGDPDTSPTIYYLTEDGFKESIPSPKVFQSRNFKWPDVIIIPSDELNAYPETSLMNPL